MSVEIPQFIIAVEEDKRQDVIDAIRAENFDIDYVCNLCGQTLNVTDETFPIIDWFHTAACGNFVWDWRKIILLPEPSE